MGWSYLLLAVLIVARLVLAYYRDHRGGGWSA